MGSELKSKLKTKSKSSSKTTSNFAAKAVPQSALKSDLKSDEFWMRRALKEAEKARDHDEVPIGAVLVQGGRQVASGWNQSILRKDPTAHAEILCLRSAGRRLRSYRLVDTILYVTVEPCAMCAGALVWARISKVVFGCWDAKAGALGSVMDLSKVKLNHRFELSGGVLEVECRGILQEFFASKR